MAGELQLDESQLAIARADAGARLIVTAAAGQGKTEVVLARLRGLTEQGVNVRDDVLILSFSRAAVDTIQKRASFTGLGSVHIRTFDSFAARMLYDADELDSLRSYGARIRRATELLREDPGEFEQIEHVIVDESQDLVGDRSEMVLALLSALPDAGFTVLGDPLQGIYDFQLDDEQSVSKRSSADFLLALINSTNAKRMSLSGHYRAESERMGGLVPVGETLRALESQEGSALEGHQLLDAFRRAGGDEPPYLWAGITPLLRRLLDLDTGETVAILTRDNFDALCVSEMLESEGIQHVVRRRAQDAGSTPWVAKVLAGLSPRKYFEHELNRTLANVEEAPENAWRILKEIEGLHRDFDTLDITSVNRRLRVAAPPLDLTPPDAAQVVVSTVHRSKGLEFNHVIDILPRDTNPEPLDWRALRLKYVASSRAKESLDVVENILRPKGYPKKQKGRWIDRRFAGSRIQRPVRIEVLNEDVVSDVPQGPDKLAVAAGQAALSGQSLLGTIVELVLLQVPTYPNSAVYWIQLPDGHIVGRMSDDFSNALKTEIIRPTPGRPTAWPVRLHGARITSVETAVGEPDDTAAAALGASGFWLVPRLTGLVRPEWPSKTGQNA